MVTHLFKAVFLSCLLPALASVAPAAHAATVGYDYTIQNAELESVSAPSLAAVNDPDGYQIIVGATSFSILPGMQEFFADYGLANVTEISLRGIDPALNLDPSDATAFPLAVTLINITGAPGVTIDPVVSSVPLPAAGWMLVAGLGGLIAVRRRKTV
ncbi:MAG: VPLPA-CTERM sorting domain-containing protein [Pseudomonadota bacterium]